MYYKNSPNYLESCDSFWLKKYFDITIFQKIVLRTCNLKIQFTKTATIIGAIPIYFLKQ